MSIDKLWAEHIGSHFLDEQTELRLLQELDKVQVLSWQQIYQLYLQSKWWRALRGKVLRRDGYRCVTCKSRSHLHVHHKRYRGLGNERMEDLETMCWYCHVEETESRDMAAQSPISHARVNLKESQLFAEVRNA